MTNNGNSTKLKELLKDCQNDNFAIIEPGGNHGDRLIYEGFEQLLKTIGIPYKSFNYLERLRGDNQTKIRRGLNILGDIVNRYPVRILELDDPDTIYIHGGGNFSDLWGITLELFKNLANTYPETRIIVGPQTYWFSSTNLEKELQDLEQPIDLFCREGYSYALLSNYDLPDNISIHQSQDTALYLNEEYLNPFYNPNNKPDEDYELLAFRTDKESIIQKQKIDEIYKRALNPVVNDISDKETTSFSEFVSLVEGADKVYTDRLHVSLLSVILGTKVTLYENIYYKNRGVYKYSLSENESVTFKDAVNCN